MQPDYYSQISAIGSPIIELLEIDDYLCPTCIETIYTLEALDGGWNFNMSSALKYLWRLGQKTADCTSDLKKAITYLQWEYDSNEDGHRVRVIARAIAKARQVLYVIESQQQSASIEAEIDFHIKSFTSK